MTGSSDVGASRHFVPWVAAVFLAFVGLAAILAPALPLADPYQQVAAERLEPPSRKHWLGTDDLGRDVLSRLVYGGRCSLLVGLVAVGLAAGLGIPLGIAGGYAGGWADRLIVSVVEIVMAFPGVLLALVLVAVMGPSLVNVMIAVGLSQAPHFARQARASTLTAREMDYVAAARSFGATGWFILTRHLLPNVLAPLVVVATMGLGGAILDAAGLGFLGLAGDPSRPEWGGMLTADRERFLTQPWLVLAPGVAITGAVLSFNLLGDAVRDWLDPRV